MKKDDQKSSSFLFSLLPIVIILLYGIGIIYLRGKVPSAADLLVELQALYLRFGYILVLVAALLEGLFLIGMYVPGTAAMLLGAALSKTGVVSLPLVILIGTVGLVTSQCINYVLGKYGWYHVLSKFGLQRGLDEAKKKLQKHQGKAILLGYISPNPAAFLSTAAGLTRMPFRKFLMLSIIAQLFWATAWGVTAYVIGAVFVEYFLKFFGVVTLLGILLWFGWGWWKKKRATPLEP